MTTLEKIKLHMRITHTKLDTEIQDAIDAAELDMRRVGVSQTVLTAPDALVLSAIKTYVDCEFEQDEKRRELFHNAYISKVEGIRRSNVYKPTEEVIEG